MDAAYLSAFAALAGSLIGGLTSLGASWLTQHTQLRGQQRTRDISRREDLYNAFIDEASKLYADAFVHDQADVSQLVRLYALISKMRVLSSARVVETADEAVRIIIETYLGPNRTLRDVKELLNGDVPIPFGSSAKRVAKSFVSTDLREVVAELATISSDDLLLASTVTIPVSAADGNG